MASAREQVRVYGFQSAILQDDDFYNKAKQSS